MRHFIAATATALTLACPVAADTVLLGANTGQIGELDTNTGLVSNIFDTGSQSWFDIAVNNAGMAYGVSNGSTLYSIDFRTQSATQVGNTGAFVNGLAFGAGGALFATGGNGLYSLDTGTGAASLVGSGIGGTFGSSGDIAYAGGTTFYGSSGRSCGGIGDCLWSIDSSTGVGSAIGAIGVSDVYGLGISDGTLFGATARNQLFSIDTLTGAGTLLTSFTISNSASTFGAAVPPSNTPPVPVPAALPLLMAGIAGLGVVGRRKRKHA